MTIETPTVNGKQPIVNGSVNPTLTAEELTQFDTETKRYALWTLKVSSEYAHNYQDIESSIFTPLEYPLTYDEIKAADDATLDAHIHTLTTLQDEHRQKLERETWRFFVKLGKEFHAALKTYRVGGEFKMPLPQLCGFVFAGGAWNGFDPAKVVPMLRALDKTFPRLDYGINNPNTGKRQHFFTIEGATIKIKVDYLKAPALDEVRAWFKAAEPMIRREAHADEARLIVRDFEISETTKAHDATIRMWWD